MEIKNIIFDLGGVLIDWNPIYLYKEIFDTQEEIDYFLNNVCTSDWNEMQDAGRSTREATEILVNDFPEFKKEIELYYSQWEKMLGGQIYENVTIFEKLLKSLNFQIYALTNWSGETWPIAQDHYPFLQKFEGVVVSGFEKLRKPNVAFYNILLERYNLSAHQCLFIDDNLRNIQAAQNLGFKTIHCPPGTNLRKQLKGYDLYI